MTKELFNDNKINDKKIWDFVKNKLKHDDAIEAEIYNSYLSKTEVFERIENNLIISTKNKITEKIIDAIQNKISNIIKREFNLKLIIKYKKIIEQKKMIRASGSYYDRFQFDNFIEGLSNKEASFACREIASNPGTKWNPLFIYGESGIGKTHLLLSIRNKILKMYPDYTTSYITSEKFGQIAINNMSKGHQEIEIFKNSFKKSDVLLIDDIQLLAKRVKTNELLFYIINHFIKNNKQIVLTSDKMPEDLSGFEKRMISRFNNGLSIRMNPPDFITAKKIVELKLKNQRNFNSFSEDAIEFIAKNFGADVRKIEGAINRMMFYIILNKDDQETKINIEDVEQAFSDKKFIINKKNTSIKEIQEKIVEEYNITLKILKGKSRLASVVKARQLAMYLCRKMTDKSLTVISLEFNRKDHTTVINSVKKIEQKLNTDKNFKKYVDMWLNN